MSLPGKPSLPIRRVTLYKHGLGFFERRGAVSGEQLRLDFQRAAMDDVLKSLVVLDRVGQVLGLDFETPPDRNEEVHREQLELSEHASLTDTLTALRGRAVRVMTSEQATEGVLIGVDLEQKNRLERALLSLYQPQARRVVKLPLERLESFEILDDAAAGDLGYALARARRDEDRASALLRLSQGEHDLTVSYIAPAPAWRVSYRVIAEHPARGGEGARDIYLQGWGLFDNTLEEDLDGVQLSLMAGMPVSFRYALFAPSTPERPLIEDEERTVNAPIEYAAMAAPPAGSFKRSAMLGEVQEGAAGMDWMEPERGFAGQMAQSVQPVSSGEARGALFAYKVAQPVSVARGQSGMVPLLSATLAGRRELLYNHARHAGHPAASLRFGNASGFTLERGPVTVLEAGEYAGEAVLDFSPVGAEIILAFAVELGIAGVQRVNHRTEIHRLSVRDGYLLVEEYQLRRTRYEFTSKLDAPAVLTLEHDRAGGHELFDMAAPAEQTLLAARWQLQLAEQSRTEFVVNERALRQRHEKVRGLSFESLQKYLADRVLDAASYAALKAVRELYAEVEAADAALKDLDREREKLYKRQTQIQGNLTPLGQNGDEGKLRSRLVRELDASEDRLRETETEAEELHALRVQKEASAAGAIAALEKS
ncbi:hypothetical protein [Deinococcus sp.]|uniref:hypothetical protein n=1 Tax=Deinococcus sp. TaxID=47478 RepID=UPI003C79D142